MQSTRALWVGLRVVCLHRPDEVEDIVQEVFMIAMTNLDTLTDPPQIRGGSRRSRCDARCASFAGSACELGSVLGSTSNVA